MESSKKPGPCRIVGYFVRKFLEAMEERVNDDNIGVQTIDSRRNNKIEANAAHCTVQSAQERIQKKPGEKLQEIMTGNGRNFMPDNHPRGPRGCSTRLNNREALNPLCIKMTLATLFILQSGQ